MVYGIVEVAVAGVGVGGEGERENEREMLCLKAEALGHEMYSSHGVILPVNL